MKITGLYSIVLGFGLFSATLAHAASAVSAKKDAVVVTAQPAKDSAAILTLKKGESVEAIERKGMYWQVKTGSGETGYVSVMYVVMKASESDKSLSKAIREAAKVSRSDSEDVAGVRARSAVMGVRGLDESEETAFAGNVRPNLRMVYAMEDRTVSAKKIRDLQASVSSEIEDTYQVAP